MTVNSPRAAVADALAKAGAPGAPVPVAAMNRILWQQQLAAAEATERVNDRQINLLFAQRAVIDDQLAEATRRRDAATRDVLTAQQMLGGLSGAEQ